MKLTLIALSVLGSLTYAIIWIAQAQHEQDVARAAADAAPVDAVVVERELEFVQTAEPAAPTTVDSVATLPGVEVSDLSNAGGAPLFEGDAWPAGVTAFERGDFRVAVAALEVAVDEKESSPYRHYLLGLTYRRLGDGEAAVVELERSLELAPTSVRTAVNLGRAYLDVDDTENARMAVDRALDIDLDHGDAWHVLGRVELAAQNFEEAAAAFAKATDRDPEHAWALNNRGYALIQIARFAEAVEPLRAALALGVEEAVFYNNLGVALERTERPALAALAYGRALVLGHGPAEISYGRVETIAIASGDTVPTVDEAETIDAVTLATRVAEATADDTELALDETDPEVVFDEVLVEFPILEAHR